jgi:hypothetical protein
MYKININRRFLWQETICQKTCCQVRNEVCKTSVTGMLYPADVFEFIIDRFNNSLGPRADAFNTPFSCFISFCNSDYWKKHKTYLFKLWMMKGRLQVSFHEIQAFFRGIQDYIRGTQACFRGTQACFRGTQACFRGTQACFREVQA